MAAPTLAIFPASEEPPRSIRALAEQVAVDGGAALAAYREPVGKTVRAVMGIQGRAEHAG